MPSKPRPKPLAYAEPPTEENLAATAQALEAENAVALPKGATVGTPPTEGTWFALVGPDGKRVKVDGNPVRMP